MLAGQAGTLFVCWLLLVAGGQGPCVGGGMLSGSGAARPGLPAGSGSGSGLGLGRGLVGWVGCELYSGREHQHCLACLFCWFCCCLWLFLCVLLFVLFGLLVCVFCLCLFVLFFWAFGGCLGTRSR